MSSAARKGIMASRRYLFAKFFSAAEEAVHTLMAPKATVASESQSVISQAMSKFQEAYTRRMTTTMKDMPGAKHAGRVSCMSMPQGGKARRTGLLHDDAPGRQRQKRHMMSNANG
eukprot:363534-Chlamydomonas_euryale.AAC.4